MVTEKERPKETRQIGIKEGPRKAMHTTFTLNKRTKEQKTLRWRQKEDLKAINEILASNGSPRGQNMPLLK